MGLKETIFELKRQVVLEKILECEGNLSAAARELEVHRNTIDRLCKDLGINAKTIKYAKSLNVPTMLLEKEKQHDNPTRYN
jgi:DNA-binding NtrC family response regulator